MSSKDKSARVTLRLLSAVYLHVCISYGTHRLLIGIPVLYLLPISPQAKYWSALMRPA